MVDKLAQHLMEQFAHSTGLTGGEARHRYLWTDAYAVGNFLTLYRRTNDGSYLELALTLVDQVHQELGRHREDDPRTGWISGLSEEEGASHPTRGGLRIGKKLNERAPGEWPDSRLEWDQDGQYFHYLTRWMLALYCVYQATGKLHYLDWAAELAIAAHRAFTYEVAPGYPKRMYWKMSIDLSRPLVSSMGHQDPLDGLITYLEIRSVEHLDGKHKAALDLAIIDFTQMGEQSQWTTDDPLGIGGLLDDAKRLAELVFHRQLDHLDLLGQLIRDIKDSLRVFSSSTLLLQPAEHRLAFRELGLSIGIHEASQLLEFVRGDRALGPLAQEILRYETLSGHIDAFWSRVSNQATTTWREHLDINSVMLATSLLSRV